MVSKLSIIWKQTVSPPAAKVSIRHLLQAHTGMWLRLCPPHELWGALVPLALTTVHDDIVASDGTRLPDKCAAIVWCSMRQIIYIANHGKLF